MSVETQNSSIRQLIKDVRRDATNLVSYQAELAKTELKSSQQNATTMGASLALAAVTGVLGVIFLLVTIAYVLVELGLPVWAGFGIVTLVLLIVATIAGLVGAKKAKRMKGLVPSTKAEIERTKAALTGKAPGTDLAAPVVRLPEQRA
jgi:uncharacterized membrane protein YqjE